MEENFMHAKKQAMLCMEDLLDKVDQCTALGMLDPASTMHNEVLSLEKNISSASSFGELDDLIETGKSLEKNLDYWIATHGRDTVSLPWPQIP